MATEEEFCAGARLCARTTVPKPGHVPTENMESTIVTKQEVLMPLELLEQHQSRHRGDPEHESSPIPVFPFRWQPRPRKSCPQQGRSR